MTLTVDEYVKTNILPQHQDVVKAIRDLMRECAPNAKEYIAYGIPSWKVNKIFAVISPNKKDITFTFTHGAEFEDKYGLLKAGAKVARHVKIKVVHTFTENQQAPRASLRRPLEINPK